MYIPPATPQYHSNYSTMLLTVLREHIELYLHSGVLLEQASISSKDLDEIFNAKKKLSIDQMMSILYKLNFDQIIPLSLHCCRTLQNYGFYFQNGGIDVTDDDLLRFSSSFFGNKEKIEYLVSTNSYFPIGNTHGIPTFILYCINSEFRTNFQNGSFMSRVE